MPVSIFGHVQITLETVSMNDWAAPNVARNKACQTLSIHALYALDSHAPPAPLDCSGKSNFARKSSPLPRNFAPAFAAGRITFVNLYNLTSRPDFFFALPRFARRRFFHVAFGRTKCQSCGWRRQPEPRRGQYCPQERGRATCVASSKAIYTYKQYYSLPDSYEKCPKTVKKILDAPLKRIFILYHTT